MLAKKGIDYIKWLSDIGFISIKNKYELIKYFDSTVENIWKASKKELIESNILNIAAIDKLIKSKNEDFLKEQIDYLYKNNIEYITICDNQYPELLKQIQNPPLGLYVKGKFPDDNIIKVSVIGARDCSDYGHICSYEFSKIFAQNGIVIVSGMARGVDSAAHKGAIDGNGKTIAVLGCGIDICYPKENERLMKKIIENGCVITEYPLGTAPIGKNFPIRNRIISGLSKATVVIEAAQRSGTSITVEYALDQGRDVFAVPGNITSGSSAGVNAMIKNGAYILTEPSDLFSILGIKENKNIKENENIKHNKKIIANNLESDEKIVYDCISYDPITADEIAIKTKKNIKEIQCALTMLELKGNIQKLRGQKYILKL